MNSERITQIFLGSFMILALIFGTVFMMNLNAKPTARQQTTSQGQSEQFSIDNPSEPYATLSLDQIDELVKSGRKQMLLISCRYCPHCQRFEPTVKEFIKKNKFSRNVVQKWEAGYRCFIPEGQEGYEKYEELSAKIIAGGVPQFSYIEGGKVVDSLETRSVDGLEAFFKKHGYEL